MATPTDSRQAHWDAVYATRRPDEVSWHQAHPALSLDLIARSGKGPDARIVDVGGGASRLVDTLLASGHRHLTVLDVSPEALARARERLGDEASRVTWIAADVTRWTPDGSFDVWHDRAVFHFLVDPADRQAYRATLDRAVVPGGAVIIGTFAPDGPERCSGLPVARYDPEALAVELGPSYRLEEGVREDHVTPGGRIQRFQFSRFVRV